MDSSVQLRYKICLRAGDPFVNHPCNARFSNGVYEMCYVMTEVEQPPHTLLYAKNNKKATKK